MLGRSFDDILLRGRWAAATSGRHYLQAGRQLLLGVALPPEVSDLARRVLREGLHVVLLPDARQRLRA